MLTQNTSGTFPFLLNAINDVSLLCSVQDAVACSCARYLREGGYLTDQQEEPLLNAYRERLNARPSFARAIDGGRPFRSYFPLGAPGRD